MWQNKIGITDVISEHYKVTKIYSQITSFAKEYLKNNDASHNFEHAERVAKLAFLISNGEGIKDFEVLKRIYVAAILHDIEDHKYTNQKGIVKKYLEKIKYPHIKEVVEIINNVSYTKEKSSNPLILNLESKIVQDADRLDALGAMGIARCFVYTGSKNKEMYDPNRTRDNQPNTGIGHFYDKLFKLESLLKTKMGRLIAKDKIKFMKEFVNRFLDENKPF